MTDSPQDPRTIRSDRLALIPVVHGVRYHVTSGGEPVGTVSKAHRRDGFHADPSSVIYPTPRAASLALLGDEPEEHFCGSTACDGGCQERAVEQFDRGQM